LEKKALVRERRRTDNLDPVTLAILNKRFDGITTKMANTVLRTGRSGVLNLARDFSTSIVTKDCELLTGFESLPIHCLSGADLMAKAVKTFHPELSKGDAYLHNSPYHGCSHPADHTILVPVIDEKGEHHFTVWVKAHQADIGNSKPTTYMGEARDVYEEGTLVFPAVKVQHEYKDIDDVIRMCEMRIRAPEQWRGDFLAMLGAARIGEREILLLADEYGWGTLHQFCRDWFNYSEKMMIGALRKMPSGRATATSTHDPVAGTPDEGIKITVQVTIDAENGLVEVDLRNNPDTMPCGLNVSEACTRTAAMIGVFNSIPDDVPTNAGSFRRLRIHLREDCIIGGGRHPTSMSVSTTNLADRISNPVQRAFSKISDGIGLAECGAINTASTAVISGIDRRKNPKTFVNQVFLMSGGGAGAPETDAWITILHTGNAGMCFIDSVELDELHFPILVKSRGIVPDSEGSGRTTGAPAVFCEYGPLDDHDLRVVFVSDGRVNAAKGTRGGMNGAKARSILVRNAETTELPACVDVTLGCGDTILSHSAGGGGYGPPHQRSIESVKHDVEQGLLSRTRAHQIYGVVFVADSWTIDDSQTRQRRIEIETELSRGSSLRDEH
jgi:N-methylhydantoinase B